MGVGDIFSLGLEWQRNLNETLFSAFECFLSTQAQF